jgi:hypothetical protein
MYTLKHTLSAGLIASSIALPVVAGLVGVARFVAVDVGAAGGQQTATLSDTGSRPDLSHALPPTPPPLARRLR